MITVWIKHKPEQGYGALLDRLAEQMPGIVAPQMNIKGRSVHNGGVGEGEVMVEFLQFTRRDRNINDIQIRILARAFPERLARVDEATEEIKQGVKCVLRDFDRNVKVGVSLLLVQMGYATI